MISVTLKKALPSPKIIKYIYVILWSQTQPGRGGRQHGGGWHQSWNVCTTVPSACGAGWEWGGRSPGEVLRLSVGLICKHNATILPEETCSVESQTWRKFFFFKLYEIIHHSIFLKICSFYTFKICSLKKKTAKPFWSIDSGPLPRPLQLSGEEVSLSALLLWLPELCCAKGCQQPLWTVSWLVANGVNKLCCRL